MSCVQPSSVLSCHKPMSFLCSQVLFCPVHKTMTFVEPSSVLNCPVHETMLFVCSQLNIHGHDLKQLIDAGFHRLDHSPADGVVMESEWDVLIERDDVNSTSVLSIFCLYMSFVKQHIVTHF